MDFVVDGDKCVVFGEAKWLSGEGRAQGQKHDKGQMQLRREFLSKYGRKIYGERGFVVLGVYLNDPIEVPVPKDSTTVVTRGLRWHELAGYSGHPCEDEFHRYLAWKRHTHRSDRHRPPA